MAKHSKRLLSPLEDTLSITINTDTNIGLSSYIEENCPENNVNAYFERIADLALSKLTPKQLNLFKHLIVEDKYRHRPSQNFDMNLSFDAQKSTMSALVNEVKNHLYMTLDCDAIHTTLLKDNFEDFETQFIHQIASATNHTVTTLSLFNTPRSKENTFTDQSSSENWVSKTTPHTELIINKLDTSSHSTENNIPSMKSSTSSLNSSTSQDLLDKLSHIVSEKIPTTTPIASEKIPTNKAVSITYDKKPWTKNIENGDKTKAKGCCIIL